MPVLISSTQSSVQHCIQVLLSSKEKRKEEVTGSTQGTSIETVQALSYVSLLTLIAMFGLLSFPRNKVGIANEKKRHYCEISVKAAIL